MQLRKDNQDLFVKRHGIKLGFMSAFVKATAHALTQQPTVNAVIDGNEIVYRDYVDISIAVATPKVGHTSNTNLPIDVKCNTEIQSPWDVHASFNLAARTQ